MSEPRKAYKTAARLRITDFLKKNADRSVTVREISESLDADNAGINLSTIYRYLGALTADGTVSKYVSDIDETALYQYVGPTGSCSDHLHMQCRKCGRMIHLDCDFMDSIAGHILEHHGFEIICKGSILFGLCERCRTCKE